MRRSGIARHPGFLLILAAVAVPAGPGCGREDRSGRDASGEATADATPTDLVETGVEDPAGDRPGADLDPPDAGFVPVPAVTSCLPTASPCTSVDVDPGIFASYRKDSWLPQADYDERTEPPLDGGRFHIAAVSKVTGRISGVFVNGHDVADLLVEPRMEWSHVWPEQVEAGKPVWLAFHSRDPAWDQATGGDLRIETDHGVAVEGRFPVNVNVVPAGAVTTAANRDGLWFHLRNADSVPHTVTRVLLDGRDVTGTGIVCLPDATLRPGGSAMWRLPFCGQADLGVPYTVVVEFADAPPSVSVGRVLRPFFPIEVWPSTSDCALPGHADAFWDDLDAIGADTVYFYWGGFERCGFDRDVMLGQTLPANDRAYVLLGDDFPFHDPPPDPLPVRDHVLGFLTGDESDWTIYDEETGFPNAAKKAADTTAVWRLYPDLLTYNGAMTNKHVGIFAGMSDIQGIDFYNAACAPHVTEIGRHPPLRGPYDYLRNARDNHMPWLTWFYSQGTGGWDGHALPHEIAVQAISVMAAGAKGLMWFMATQEGRDRYPDTWQAMSDMNHVFKGVRPYLLWGDLTGLARSDDATITDLIRSRDALVVPVVTTRAAREMTDEDCVGWSLGFLDAEPHWVLEARTTDVTVTIPDDFAVNDLFEVTATGIREIDTPIRVQGRDVTLAGVPLSDAQPVHVYVLVTDPAQREAVVAAMNR